MLTPGGRVRYRRERRLLSLGGGQPTRVSDVQVTEGDGWLANALCPLLLGRREWYFVMSMAHGMVVIDATLGDTIEPQEGR